MYSGKKYLSHRVIDRLAPDNNAVSGGFPHSDIPGSKGALASPGLIAECHVLHRLLLPRHPPNALLALDPIQKQTGPFAWQWFAANPRPWSEVDSTRRASRRIGGGNDLSIDAAFSVSVIDLERLFLVSDRVAA